MNAKTKECFTPHIIMHSAFGLGLGLVLVSLAPAFANLWLGVILMIVATVADVMRK